MRRWRILVLVGVMLAITLMPLVKTEAATPGKPVRVGLYYGSTALHDVRLSSADGLALAYLPAGADTPLPLYSQEGQTSWAVRQDGYRIQFGPYATLDSAKSALAILNGDDIRFVVKELDKYYVRFGAYDNSAVAEQLLKLMPSQPGVVIGSYRVGSQTLTDLAAAQTLEDATTTSGFSAALAWVGDGWQVWTGHETDATKAETMRNQLSSAQAGATWSVVSPNMQRSEVYTFEGELRCSLPAMDIYIGAIGGERGGLSNPPLTTIYNGATGKQYRGFVELTLQTTKLYRVILYLTMDQYLMGVLPGEVPTSWPLEVLKAQAIVSRNFCESSRGKHASEGFDVCTTTNCQMYVDFSREKDSTRQAVIETAGVYITYNGKVTSAYFSSDAGGFSESLENVWGGSAVPWMVGTPELFPDPSPYANWEKDFTAAELSALLKKNGVSIGTVASIQATGFTAAGQPPGYSESGRVMGLRLVDTSGKSVTLTGDSPLRLYLSLFSRKYTVQPDIPPVSILGADGQVVSLAPTGLKVANADGVASLAQTDVYRIKGASSTASSSAAATGFVFKGSGSGHGAGLSQWGAYAMANHGKTYEEIIAYYFHDTKLLQLGD